MAGKKAYSIDLVHRDGSNIIRLEGEMDATAQLELMAIARPLVERLTDDPLILDMADVTFLDSSAIGALLALREAASDPRLIQVSQPSVRVRRVLELTGLHFLIGAADTPDPDGLIGR